MAKTTDSPLPPGSPVTAGTLDNDNAGGVGGDNKSPEKVPGVDKAAPGFDSAKANHPDEANPKINEGKPAGATNLDEGGVEGGVDEKTLDALDEKDKRFEDAKAKLVKLLDVFPPDSPGNHVIYGYGGVILTHNDLRILAGLSPK